MSGPEVASGWEVVVERAYNPGDPADGAEAEVLMKGPEPEARRVYADTVAVAAEQHYARVLLRSGGQNVEFWPQKAGWTC
jgi:hypothetical protein